MLLGLTIRDVVLIDRLSLAFRRGLCVLTGETGAGKSILLDALGLALGRRAEAGLVRAGAKEAAVAAEFAVGCRHPAHAILRSAGREDAGETIVLRRLLATDGRSRAFVNDEPSSVGLLRELGDSLVEIQGQFEQRGLLEPANHRMILDAFADQSVGPAGLARAWDDWREALARETAAARLLAASREEEELLRHHLAETADALATLETAAGQLELDPRELEKLEERLFALRGLARKHQVSVAELPALQERMAAQLAAIEEGAENVEHLVRHTREARGRFVAAAETVSRARACAARRLDAAVAAELAPLRLDRARFRTVLTPLDEAEWSEHGCERVHFEIATTPGAPFGPLARIASGGELSRFMLALKLVLADTSSVPTLIFDEVDSGIGGAVAAAVGEPLQPLAIRRGDGAAAVGERLQRLGSRL